MSTTTLNKQRARRLIRIRAKIHGTTARPRLSVSRTLAHICAQVIDDTVGKTIAAAADRDLDAAAKKGTKTEQALAVGKLVAERAKKKGVTAVVFDRRDKKYHGRVRAVAEGAREAGLTF